MAVVPPWMREHAAAPPEPKPRPWTAERGVFIHHRGAGSADLADEADCIRDIAEVYEGDRVDENLDYDIGYNFLVCPHGNIYEGRGYERGEANSDGYVGGYGRNTAFYSICGLVRSDDVPGETLLRAIRDLIAHLRAEAPKRAGNDILPHQFEHEETDCPGNLRMYAYPASTIDPTAPWTGLEDIQVFWAQHFVNKIYGDVPGYIRCKETGRTGWPTVLSLTQALQHELGISPVVQNFGAATFEAVKAKLPLPMWENRPYLLTIYNAAFWCKGYWASSVRSGVWEDSQGTLERFYADAGLEYGDVNHAKRMWPYVLKAMLRMDQFRLVAGGSAPVRTIQQWLNARYVDNLAIPAMGLVPCDGWYSRDVQQGLMMAIQYEIGIAPSAINGYFGPGTQNGLRTRATGTLTGNLRRLFRAACYVNSPAMVNGTPLHYRAEDIDTDAQTATHVAWLQAFQRFTQLPVTGTNDYATWAQLLVSCGDTTRPGTGADCVTEITAARGKALYDAGYRIVGRYLDEHLPPEDEHYLGKALKPGEPQRILDAGLRLFPLFQYNGTQLDNFTYEKGYAQGLKAHEKAAEHRLPAGTCVYFAVDYDAMDVDIDFFVKPYFSGVHTAFAELGNRYQYGVYGSRNVCTRVSADTGARWSFVAGMPWGYSGNLGFPMPANWSLNQIREYEFQPGWGLDHNVWRAGGDPGVSALDP
ncbi:glycoside hydrolase domain-containing protein [Actinoplanes sp. NPDC051861]|uniref:glycoside hydrolase domain-containing protein n=1 Tax=Actinoplanes sp. NPDC051861 TaxID=3155170 RepID=UPI00342DFB0A